VEKMKKGVPLSNFEIVPQFWIETQNALEVLSSKDKSGIEKGLGANKGATDVVFVSTTRMKSLATSWMGKSPERFFGL
jgi:hypothetical protein